MDPKKQDEFLNRIKKSLYFGKRPALDSVSLPLTEIAAELFNEAQKENTLEQLGVPEVIGLNKNACVSTCSLVLAILYLEKIKNTNPTYVERVSPSELFLVSLLVATKFLNDNDDEDFVSNYEWATCSNMSLKTVNQLEKEFLQAMNWEVFVSEEKFWARLKTLERYFARREAKKRGWLTYTETITLMSGNELHLLLDFLKYSTVCISCYCAALLSLLSSAFSVIRMKYIVLNSLVYIITTNKPETTTSVITNEGDVRLNNSVGAASPASTVEDNTTGANAAAASIEAFIAHSLNSLRDDIKNRIDANLAAFCDTKNYDDDDGGDDDSIVTFFENYPVFSNSSRHLYDDHKMWWWWISRKALVNNWSTCQRRRLISDDVDYGVTTTSTINCYNVYGRMCADYRDHYHYRRRHVTISSPYRRKVLLRAAIHSHNNGDGGGALSVWPPLTKVN